MEVQSLTGSELGVAKVRVCRSRKGSLLLVAAIIVMSSAPWLYTETSRLSGCKSLDLVGG